MKLPALVSHRAVGFGLANVQRRAADAVRVAARRRGNRESVPRWARRESMVWSGSREEGQASLAEVWNVRDFRTEMNGVPTRWSGLERINAATGIHLKNTSSARPSVHQRRHVDVPALACRAKPTRRRRCSPPPRKMMVREKTTARLHRLLRRHQGLQGPRLTATAAALTRSCCWVPSCRPRSRGRGRSASSRSSSNGSNVSSALLFASSRR